MTIVEYNKKSKKTVTKWLEKVKVEQEFTRIFRGIEDGDTRKWINTRFIN